VAISFLCVTSIEAPIDSVFDLARDIDVHMESMQNSGERAIAGVTAGRIGLREQVTWRGRHFGIPFRLTSRIEEMTAPSWFVDEQLRGPFRRYRHEHRFLETKGTTEMRDQVFFRAPFGPVGWLVERLILGHYMKHLIETRNAHIKSVAEGKPTTPS
jgi:ligand-binding SRPBCC domain-containing protein